MRTIASAFFAAILLMCVAAEMWPEPRQSLATAQTSTAARQPPSRLAKTGPAVGHHTAVGLLGRPPFDPTRLPPRDAPAPVTAAVRALPRLSGVAVNDVDRLATFTDATAAAVLREGDRFGSFMVLRIAPGEVTMRGPDGQRVIHTALAPTPPEPATPAVPAPESPLQQRSAAGPLPYGSAQLAPPPS